MQVFGRRSVREAHASPPGRRRAFRKFLPRYSHRLLHFFRRPCDMLYVWLFIYVRSAGKNLRGSLSWSEEGAANIVRMHVTMPRFAPANTSHAAHAAKNSIDRLNVCDWQNTRNIFAINHARRFGEIRYSLVKITRVGRMDIRAPLRLRR